MDYSWDINSNEKFRLSSMINSKREKAYFSFQTVQGSLATTSLNYTEHLIVILSLGNTSNSNSILRLDFYTFGGYFVTTVYLTEYSGKNTELSLIIFRSDFIVIVLKYHLMILSDFGAPIVKQSEDPIQVMDCSVDGYLYSNCSSSEIQIFSQDLLNVRKFEPYLPSYGELIELHIMNDIMAILSCCSSGRFKATLFSISQERLLRSLQITFPFEREHYLQSKAFEHIRIDLHGDVFITFFNSRYFIKWHPDDSSEVLCLSGADFSYLNRHDKKQKVDFHISDDFQMFRSNCKGEFRIYGQYSLYKTVYRLSEFQLVPKSFSNF